MNHDFCKEDVGTAMLQDIILTNNASSLFQVVGMRIVSIHETAKVWITNPAVLTSHWQTKMILEKFKMTR